MPPSAHRIVLIAFTCCPRGGVGSRRWSKFAKYLSREGFELDIVSGAYPYRDKVNWCHDVTGNPAIRLHHTPTGFPAYLLRPRRNFLIKLGTRILARTTHGVDYAQRWPAYMVPKVGELLLSGGCDAVVMTVGPFSPLLAAPEIRRRYPNVPFVLDFRDPWLYCYDIARGYTPEDLQRAEHAAIASADEVWVTTPEHGALVCDTFGTEPDKVIVITNGYDPDDYVGLSGTEQSDEWVVVYAGSVTGERLRTLLALLRGLDACAIDAIKARFRIHLYSNSSIPLDRLTPPERRAFKHFVRRKDVVAPRELYGILQQARFGLTLDVTTQQYTIPSKVYDCIGMRKRLIYLGSSSEIVEEMAAAGHYCSAINDEAIADLLRRIAKDEREAGARTDPPAMEKYSLPRLAEKVTQRLSHLRKLRPE